MKPTWTPIDNPPSDGGDYIIAIWRLRQDGHQDYRQKLPIFKIALFEKRSGMRNDWHYQRPAHPCPWGYKISHWAAIPEFDGTINKIKEIGNSPIAKAAAIAAGIKAITHGQGRQK